MLTAGKPDKPRAAEAALDLPDDAGLVAAGERAPDPAFASPVRDEEGAIILLDVRALPAQILERRAESAAAVAIGDVGLSATAERQTWSAGRRRVGR
jgi:hypothetical protein